MATAAVTTEYCNLSLQELRESPTNPRQHFEENTLKELAESIKTQGVLSPILVRPLPEGFPEHFEIVTGARRFRAAQLAGLDSVPVRIVSLSDNEVLEIQVIENLHRSELHPLDEARGFLQLLQLDSAGYDIHKIGAKIAKSPGYVSKLCFREHKSLLCCLLIYVGSRSVVAQGVAFESNSYNISEQQE